MLGVTFLGGAKMECVHYRNAGIHDIYSVLIKYTETHIFEIIGFFSSEGGGGI